MLAKFSPAISSGLLLPSTQLASRHSDASRFGLSFHVAMGGVPWVITPSDTWTPGVPPALLPLVVVCEMNTLPVFGSTIWFPEIPSLSVTQLRAPAPAQPFPPVFVIAVGSEFTTGTKWVPSVDSVSTSWLPPLAEELTAS